MMTDSRLVAIADLCQRAHQRMDPAYPWQLLHACSELVDEVRRLTPRQTRLDLEAAN